MPITLSDFHNGPVAKLKNNWHAQGMTLQGEAPIDLSTFNGLREKFLKDVGQAPPKNMEGQLQKIAKAVRAFVWLFRCRYPMLPEPARVGEKCSDPF
jgi:hypothetical protein